MRKLASIRTINEVLEHPNADALEIAIVDGWQCIVAKGKHSDGDKVIFFEVDSVLPPLECFEFLRKGCYIKKDWLPKGEGFRLKTIKLRKELSQGLVMFPEEIFAEDYHLLEEGEDVTEAIGVVKYDPPVPAQLEGQAKGNFPSFIPKTDQDRIQNVYKRIMNGIANGDIVDSWEVSLKLEGSSMTIYHDLEGNWGVCSRNMDLKLDQEGNTFVDMFHKLMKTTNLRQLPIGYAIQGELMGQGIQGNIEGLSEHFFFMFDLYNIENGSHSDSTIRKAMSVALELDHTPLYYNVCKPFKIFSRTLDDLLDMADGPSMNARLREGIVFKNLVDPNISFKVISNKYLLKEKN